MSAIMTPVLLVVAMGFVFAVILTIAAKIFYVPVDETVVQLRAELPGANCGGCGFAGCDDYASALGADPEGVGCSKCPVGGAEVAAKLAAILGMEAGDAEPMVATVRCNGNHTASKSLLEYKGTNTCAAAVTLYGGMNQCKYGCLGLGDCTRACNFNAIKICDGVAVVARELCVGCGACANACPKNVITLLPKKSKVVVQCQSQDKGAATRKACENGCIGCGKCTKVCKFEAITLDGNHAVIDPEKCKNCGLCAKECPTGAINNMRAKRKPAQPKAAPAPKAEAPKAEAPKAEAPAPAAEAPAPQAEAPKTEE